ncbi:MAG: sulfotransferase [Cyanobacteria bacterium P01_F01_bin.86]
MVTTGKVVFILGIGRSGSTMLDLMLGSHSQGFSLGEISKLPQIYRQHPTPGAFCPTSNFWPEHFSETDAKQLALGLSGRRLHAAIPLRLERRFRELIGQDAIFRPYTLLMERIQKTLLVDSSKYPDWVTRQLDASEFRRGPLQAYVIHAVRDGRAVLNSYLRAFPELTVESVSKRWLKNLEDCEHLYNTLPTDRRLQVRYESLATNPNDVMRQVCAFLEVPFEPEMLAYWQHDHHYIAGSRSAKALIARYRNQPVPSNTQEVHGEYYSNMELTIKLDQRWKNELEAEKVEQFYEIVGDRNRPFEWD